MDTAVQISRSWIKEIPGELFQLDETPLLGYPPPFSWVDFTKQIKDSFQLEGLRFSPAEWRWRSKEQLFEGLGDKLRSIPLTVAPLAGTIFWVMPEQEISNLMTLFLGGQNKPSFDAIEKDFQEAFYRFLTLEVINIFEKVSADKKLSPIPMEKESLPDNHSLCQDIEITLKDISLHGRLFLTPEFRTSWTQRYLEQQNNEIYSSPLADKLSVIVHLEAGKVSLTSSEWKTIRPGDLVLMDSCSLEPDEDKGRIQLVINGTSFFRGRIKDGNIKILEHPLYSEADITMTNKPENHADDEDLFDDSELDAEIDSEIENNNTDHSMEESDTDSEFESGIESEFESEIENSEFSDSELEEESEIEPAPKEKSLKSPEKPPIASHPTQQKTSNEAKVIKKSDTTQPTKIEEVPLNIVIEVGRLQMSIKKLLELQPGNMLDLNIHPEAGVDLVLNGKRIAKGELLRIGDALGVRIIDLS